MTRAATRRHSRDTSRTFALSTEVSSAVAVSGGGRRQSDDPLDLLGGTP